MRAVDEDDRWDGLRRWTKILKVVAVLLFAALIALLVHVVEGK